MEGEKGNRGFWEGFRVFFGNCWCFCFFCGFVFFGRGGLEGWRGFGIFFGEERGVGGCGFLCCFVGKRKHKFRELVRPYMDDLGGLALGIHMENYGRVDQGTFAGREEVVGGFIVGARPPVRVAISPPVCRSEVPPIIAHNPAQSVIANMRKVLTMG